MLSKSDVERGFIYKLILIKAKSAKNSENDKKLFFNNESVLGIITIPSTDLNLFSDDLLTNIYNIQDCLFLQPKILYKNKNGIFFRGHNKSKISTRNTYLSEDDVILLEVLYSNIDFDNWKFKEKLKWLYIIMRYSTFLNM